MRTRKSARLPLIVCSLLILVSVSYASSLKTDPKVEHFLETDDGIPKFVSGDLAAPVAPGLEIKATYDFFSEHADQFRMADPERELVIKLAETDDNGQQHIRFDQYLGGVRVYGGQMISHFDSDGALYAVNGDYYPDWELSTTVRTQLTVAETIARGDLSQNLSGSELIEPELIFFRWEGSDYLAWRLLLFSEFPMGRWEYFIDANSSEVIFKANRLMSESYEIGEGTGIMGDTRTHLDTKLLDGTYYLMDYSRQANNDIHGHGGQMADGRFIRTYIAPYNLPGNTAFDSDNIWDDYESQSAAVDGHFYTMLMYDWMLRVFGRNSYDNTGTSMNVSVGYGAEGDNNAYWNGSRIVIWTASPGNRELAGCPDVIAHEWGHAITSYTSGMIYQKESGALNESFSDMIGAAFEFAHDSVDTPDWYMGENMRSGSTGFRNMADPHVKGDPDFYGPSDPYWVGVTNCSPSNQNDWCGVHTNSGVGNKWFHLLSVGGMHYGDSVTGIGVENAIKVAYQANRYYWTYNTTYVDAAYGTVVAAGDIDTTGTWANSTAEAWTAVGVIIPDNEITFVYPYGLPKSLDYDRPTEIQFWVKGVFHGTPVRQTGQLHYSIDGAPEVVLSLTEFALYRYRVDLPALDCGSRIEYYFSAEEIDNGRYYDPDPSAPYMAVPATDTVEIANWDLSYKPAFTMDDDWEYGRPNGNGGLEGVPDPPEAFTGSNIFGYNLNGDYTNGLAASHLTTEPFDCSGKSNVLLSFYRWLGVDSVESDQASISVSTDSLNWTTVWENDERISDTEWEFMEIDLSAMADDQPTVYLRWTIGPTNSDWRSCGWNIDDIQIVARECTPWICGDLSGDLKANLADITRLIDHVYISKAPLDYVRAGNVDGSADGKVNLADITRLIDFVYISRAPINCP